MANEISLTLSLRYSKNGVTETLPLGGNVSVSGDGIVGNVQTVGTSEEALVLGDVATVGMSVFKNLDATNFVELGRVDGGTFRAVAKLKAGESCAFRSALNALYAKADTSSVKLFYRLYND